MDEQISALVGVLSAIITIGGAILVGLITWIVRSSEDRTKQYVQAQVGAVQAQLGEVKERLGAVESEVGEVKQRLGVVEAEVGGLKAEVGGLKAEVGTLKEQVQTSEERIHRRIDRLEESNREEHRVLTAEVQTLQVNMAGLNALAERNVARTVADLFARASRETESAPGETRRLDRVFAETPPEGECWNSDCFVRFGSHSSWPMAGPFLTHIRWPTGTRM